MHIALLMSLQKYMGNSLTASVLKNWPSDHTISNAMQYKQSTEQDTNKMKISVIGLILLKATKHFYSKSYNKSFYTMFI